MKTIVIVNNIKGREAPRAFVDIPDSCMIRSGKPFFIPEFDDEFRPYISLAVRINRLGKCVASKFADRYWNEITLGVSIRGEKTLAELRKNGLPWSEALVFDRSLIIGDFVSRDDFREEGGFIAEYGDNQLIIDDSMLEADIDEAITIVSRNNTIKQGDIILTGLLPMPSALKATSRITGRTNNSGQLILTTNIR